MGGSHMNLVMHYVKVRHGINSNQLHLINSNRPIYVKSIASVTNCGLWLETAMVPTVNRRCELFTNCKYWKSFQKLFCITWRLRLVFQLIDTIYLSGYDWVDRSFQMKDLAKPLLFMLICRGFLAYISIDYLNDFKIKLLAECKLILMKI